MKKQKQKKAAVGANAMTNRREPTIFAQLSVLTNLLHQETCPPVTGPACESKAKSPQWCQNIFRQLGKTIFKRVLQLKPMGVVNWRNYGRMIGILERGQRFISQNMERIIEEKLGDITKQEWKRIESIMGLDELRACLVKHLNRSVDEHEPLEKLAAEWDLRMIEGFGKHREVAFSHLARQSTKNSSLFFKGMAEGFELFIDERGDFCGDRGRTTIYLCLLPYMQEVEEMRRTLPQTTRKRFYDELAKVQGLPTQAYDWFNDVCDDIKFPLNKLGRKRRNPAPVL